MGVLSLFLSLFSQFISSSFSLSSLSHLVYFYPHFLNLLSQVSSSLSTCTFIFFFLFSIYFFLILSALSLLFFKSPFSQIISSLARFIFIHIYFFLPFFGVGDFIHTTTASLVKLTKIILFNFSFSLLQSLQIMYCFFPLFTLSLNMYT